MIYCISEAEWADRYDARIELDGAQILLHSRGGATGGRPPRNTDYEKAFLTIIRRLRAQDRPDMSTIGQILLDSTVARHLPEIDRLLASSQEISGLSNEQVVTLVRQRAKTWGQAPDTKGGNSTKAIRIETQGRSHASIRSTLKLMAWEQAAGTSPDIERLPVSEQHRVMPSHVERAISRLLSGEDASNFAESRDYDVLLANGLRLAPKKVFGLALEEALGIEAFPGHFSAGWSQPCFEIIQAAGYRIIRKGDALPSAEQVDEALKDIPPDCEDRAAVEGNLKVAIHLRRERASGLAKQKKAAFIEEHGRLSCERCSMDPVDVYGPVYGYACIEVHHALVHVKDMKAGHQTKLEDLQCLCANCHRITHREMTSQVTHPQKVTGRS